MKYTQNAKILQVTEGTLIVGVDIASETHYARAFDQRGIELAKLIKFSNDAEGFKEFVSWIEEIRGKYSKDKVMVGMEPIGHYWFNIAPYLKDHGMKIVLVNPFHVKRSKELDDNSPTKNDRKDPKTMHGSVPAFVKIVVARTPNFCSFFAGSQFSKSSNSVPL